MILKTRLWIAIFAPSWKNCINIHQTSTCGWEDSWRNWHLVPSLDQHLLVSLLNSLDERELEIGKNWLELLSVLPVDANVPGQNVRWPNDYGLFLRCSAQTPFPNSCLLLGLFKIAINWLNDSNCKDSLSSCLRDPSLLVWYCSLELSSWLLDWWNTLDCFFRLFDC